MTTGLKEDLLQEILVRLPVRSLVRLTCVCKSWRALIKSSPFVHMHMIRQRTIGDDSILIKFVKGGYWKTLSYYPDFAFKKEKPDFNSNFRRIPGPQSEFEITLVRPSHHTYHMFAGHSNGIVCFTGGDFNGFLFNPALRQIRPLPIVPLWRPVECREYGVGFGFDEATNDYKVVRIIKREQVPPSYLEVEIYNLSTDRWRNFGDIPGPPTTINALESPIYFKGFIHWAEWAAMQGRILTFNTTTEVFEAMPFPRGWQDYSPTLEVIAKLLVVNNSTIALVASTKDATKFGWLMDVWVMKEYGVTESWARLYSLPPVPPCMNLGYHRGKIKELRRMKPLSFWKKDFLLLLTSQGLLICFDSATCQYYKIHYYPTSGKEDYQFWFYEVVVCKESLVSVDIV